MKNQSTLIFRQTVKSLITIISCVALLFALASCDSKSSKYVDTEIVESSGTPVPVHVAFAGGGWRAHSGHSGWIIALLANNNRKLKEAFTNVGTISSNSGGSWFSTMLMYSNSFVSEIEASGAANSWGTTGWLGGQKNYFKQSGCTNTFGDYIYQECVFDYFTDESLTGGTYWKKVVDSLVFRDFPLKGLVLSGQRAPWAVDKSLLLASTLLNNSLVLYREADDDRYYQNCLAPSTPVLDGDSGSSCSNGIGVDVTPVTFSSLPSGSKLSKPSFFPELGLAANTGTFNIGYTEDLNLFGIRKDSTKVRLPLKDDAVPVVTAAAASSAAVGFGASEHITGLFDISYLLEDDALSFQLANSTVSYVDNVGSMKLGELASNKVVRLADGGAVDNSAVIQLVRFLQQNHPNDSFNIVAFDNVEQAYNPGNGAAPLGVDLATLFGHKEDLSITINVPLYGKVTYGINTPKVKIFDDQAMKGTSVTWTSPMGADSTQLYYTKYTVSTLPNSVMGVSGGSNGTLHAFTCVSPKAETAPIMGDADFDTYDAMLKFIYSQMSTGKGRSHLEAAFGL